MLSTKKDEIADSIWLEHVDSFGIRLHHVLFLWDAYSALKRNEIVLGYFSPIPNSSVQSTTREYFKKIVISSIYTLFDRHGTNIEWLLHNAPTSIRDSITQIWHDEVKKKWLEMKQDVIIIRGNIGNHAPLHYGAYSKATLTIDKIDPLNIHSLLLSVIEIFLPMARILGKFTIDARIWTDYAICMRKPSYNSNVVFSQYLLEKDTILLNLLEEKLNSMRCIQNSKVELFPNSPGIACRVSYYLDKSLFWPFCMISSAIKKHDEEISKKIMKAFIINKTSTVSDDWLILREQFISAYSAYLTYYSILVGMVSTGKKHQIRNGGHRRCVVHDLLITLYSYLTTIFEEDKINFKKVFWDNHTALPPSCFIIGKDFIIPTWDKISKYIIPIRKTVGFHMSTQKNYARNTLNKSLLNLDPGFLNFFMACIFLYFRYAEVCLNIDSKLVPLPHRLPLSLFDPRFSHSVYHRYAKKFTKTYNFK